MRAAKRRKGLKVEVPAERSASMDCNGNTKYWKGSIRLHPKLTAQESSQQLADEGVPLRAKIVNMPQLKSENAPKPSAKIKLQLFPLHDNTRIGLEKDGHNPHLELILNARKKMSSVLKHLNSKWGNSSTAVGELMLFPYTIGLECPASCRRWTQNDSDISAGYVYASLGSPATFRLRYGWFSKFEPKISEVPCPATSLGGFLQDKGAENDCGADMETTHDKKADGMKANGNLSLPTALWADSLTSISIGGLLSEVSLQAKFNNCDPKLSRTNSVLLPVQPISDSLDAFVATQTKPQPQLQCQSQCPRVPHSSILDAEETCHAFTFHNFSSSSNNVLDLSRNTSEPGNHDASSRPFKIPNLTEANSHSGLGRGNSCQESQPDMLYRSRVYNDESSLGLTGIKWNDSLGPFDLGLSLRRIANGDSMTTFSKFFR